MGAAPFDLLGHTLGAGPSPGLGNGSITQNAPAAQTQANVGNEMSLFRFLQSHDVGRAMVTQIWSPLVTKDSPTFKEM